MSSYANHQALVSLALGESIDYRDTYDASLLQGVPRSLNRSPLDLRADNPPFYGTDIWTPYELSWLNVKGLPQVVVGHAELDYTSVNLIESKSFKLCLNSFNQTHSNNWDEVHQTLERDLGTCAQGKINVALYHLGELEDQPIGRFNGICIDDQDITIDNCEFTTDYLRSVTCDEKVAEEIFASHLLKPDCLVTHQPGRGLLQIRYRRRQIDREKLLRHLVSSRHHSEFHEQCVERISNDLLRFCRPERLSVYARYTRRGGLDINPWHSSSDSVPSTTRLI